jgi:ribose 5-phosphate isomerase A
MDQNELKKLVAKAALADVRPGEILGVGTGSTVDFFIDALAQSGLSVPACVSSSVRSTRRLEQLGFRVLEMNEVDGIGVYVDGADEIDAGFNMIKGGGGALTREKIVASVARKFVCIADASKKVPVLGKFPLPVEVIPMALRAVAARLREFGGNPVERDFTTDNGNRILDVHGLSIEEPAALEAAINQIPGVVSVGLFAARGADVLLLGTAEGVKRFERR